MRRRTASSAAAAVATALGCASATGIDPLPKSQDVKMGNTYAGEVDKQLPVEKDPAINAGVAQVGKKILEANGIKDYEFDFHVVRDDGTVNAFALPGGKIYVFSGLIGRAEDESELAGVIAHEIAHVTRRHSSKRMIDQMGVEAVEKALAGHSPTIVQSGAALITNLGFMSYSRGQEAEADKYGCEFIGKTDYDPWGMVRFFQKIQALQAKGSSVVTRFLSDHPQPADRVRSVTKEIKETLPADRQTGQTYKDRFLAYRDLVCPHGPKDHSDVLPAPPPPAPGEPSPRAAPPKTGAP